jgi:hypothetical protein
MTYKILMDNTCWVIHRSNIRLVADPNARNLHLDPLNDEPPEVIQSLCKASPASDHGEDCSLHSMEPTDENPESPSTGDDTVIVDPQELLGRTFLMDTQEDGQRLRTCIVECISYHEANVRRSDDHVKFRISVNEDEYEEIITYDELMDFIEKNQEHDAIVWRFQHIVGHQGPLLWHDKDYNGSRFKVQCAGRMGEWGDYDSTSFGHCSQQPCDLCCLCKRA